MSTVSMSVCSCEMQGTRFSAVLTVIEQEVG
jgi:hypothetical protein